MYRNYYRKSLFLSVFLSVSTLAAGIPEVKNTDEITMGRGANGDDKEFIFNIGDGATNPKLLINDTLKVFNFNKGLDVTGDGIFSGLGSFGGNVSGVNGTFSGVLAVTGDEATFGDGTNTDKKQIFDTGAGANNPYFGWSSASNALVFNNGLSEKKIGSGSGGGGGGINFILNNSFEDAGSPILNWANVGGTFSQEDHVNGREGNEKFARFISTIAGQYFESDAVTISDDVGPGCMADFKYNQGGNAFVYEVLKSPYAYPADVVSKSGQVGTLTAFDKAPSIVFPCAGGEQFKFRVTSTGAGTIDADGEVYLGSNKNQADVSAIAEQMAAFTYLGKASDNTVRFTPGIPGVSEVPGEIFTYSDDGTNGTLITLDKAADVTITARLGNTTTQGFWIQLNGSDLTAETTSQSAPVDTGSASVRVLANAGDVLRVWGSSSNFNQGLLVVTAKTRVIKESTFTPEQADFYINVNIGGSGNTVVSPGATPKVPENPNLDMVINKGSATIPCSGTNASTGLTCSSGSESIGVVFNAPVSGKYKACFSYQTFQGTSGLFTARLGLTAPSDSSILITGNSLAGTSGSESNSHRLCDIFEINNGINAIRLFTAAATSSTTFYTDRLASSFQRDVNITVELVENNVARPIINNMVDTKRKDGLRIESCYMDATGGTPTSGSVLCNHWVDSYDDDGVGEWVVNIATGTFSTPPICVATYNTANGSSGFDRNCQVLQNSATSFDLSCRQNNALADARVTFTCTGGK